MTKYIDLMEEDQEKLGDTLEVKAIQLGLDKWESRGGGSKILDDLIGICSNCESMRYCKSEFGNVIAICYSFKIKLHGRDRVVECNEHNKRGQLSLRDMEVIATLIDIDKSEIKGFISRDPKLMRKEK